MTRLSGRRDRLQHGAGMAVVCRVCRQEDCSQLVGSYTKEEGRRRNILIQPAIPIVLYTRLQSEPEDICASGSRCQDWGYVMRVKSIETSNYRTLQDIKINFSNGYNTISGKNNAGKSCIIRLLCALFHADDDSYWGFPQHQLTYREDKTQWVKNKEPIKIKYEISVDREEDSAFMSFVEKIGDISINNKEATIVLAISLNESDEESLSVVVDGREVAPNAFKEIRNRLRQSRALYLHNSTKNEADVFFHRGRPRSLFNFSMSSVEQKKIEAAGKKLEAEVKRLAKDHVKGLSEIFGRLTEKYDFDLTPPEGFVSRRMPLGISLKDKAVDIALDDWGSGTQNKTRILMAALKASRIKESALPSDRITPLLIIEEPESFLHPSAQAEFGRLLRALSADLGLQIIVTTHSPYMLNQDDPAANLLLSRTIFRRKELATRIIDTSGDEWMVPFSEHLGIGSKEFNELRPLFSSESTKVLLVEGPIDKRYFTLLKENRYLAEPLEKDIEIVPYGGKDTLKNTVLIQFVLQKFDRVFITYDLDADAEIKPAIQRAGLRPEADSLALGLSQPGKDCIEGLLPAQVLREVSGRETDFVMALGSQNSTDRRKAKEKLKELFLLEFEKTAAFSATDIRELARIVKFINAYFTSAKKISR
ncbi:ATP-dependent nuclease [Neoroseomonas rubea]|uniref:ATP-dependent nuclease n=1 Tax=Neoroseomonas rubea TaxID=2748666 RepID=UPI0018E024F5|nr:AAA family ATPase [Roseomonas rubea]